MRIDLSKVCCGNSRERVSNFSYLSSLLDCMHFKYVFYNIIFYIILLLKGSYRKGLKSYALY